MTYRERREARADRRELWADSRSAKSEASFAKAAAIADNIPLGQPILIGHHSEAHARKDQERIRSGMFAGIDHAKMADKHEAAASTIRHQLDTSIYDDDPDALDALAAKLERLEAERDTIKEFNAAIRKVWGFPAYEDIRDQLIAGLPDTLRAGWLSVQRHSAYASKKGAFPAYELSNLGGRIKATRDRIESVTRQQANQAAAEATPNGIAIAIKPPHPEGYYPAYAVVCFAEKPDRSVLNDLRAAGYSYGKGTWSGPADKLPASVSEEASR